MRKTPFLLLENEKNLSWRYGVETVGDFSGNVCPTIPGNPTKSADWGSREGGGWTEGWPQSELRMPKFFLFLENTGCPKFTLPK